MIYSKIQYALFTDCIFLTRQSRKRKIDIPWKVSVVTIIDRATTIDSAVANPEISIGRWLFPKKGTKIFKIFI